jgi:uncharacterized protein
VSGSLPVSHRVDGSRGAFEVVVDGLVRASMTYTMAGTLAIIDHTEVDDSLRGQGAGRQLVEAAVAWARADGHRILPLCPFAKSVFDKTPAFDDVRSS